MSHIAAVISGQRNSELFRLLSTPQGADTLRVIEAELARRNCCAIHGGRSLAACDHN